MEYGFVLPKLTDGESLSKFAKAVEEFGFHSIWAADHIVQPVEETNLYPQMMAGLLQVLKIHN